MLVTKASAITAEAVELLKGGWVHKKVSYVCFPIQDSVYPFLTLFGDQALKILCCSGPVLYCSQLGLLSPMF